MIRRIAGLAKLWLLSGPGRDSAAGRMAHALRPKLAFESFDPQLGVAQLAERRARGCRERQRRHWHHVGHAAITGFVGPIAESDRALRVVLTGPDPDRPGVRRRDLDNADGVGALRVEDRSPADARILVRLSGRRCCKRQPQSSNAHHDRRAQPLRPRPVSLTL